MSDSAFHPVLRVDPIGKSFGRPYRVEPVSAEGPKRIRLENLGEFLRQQREEKNVSIEELATRTRIAVRFIKLIEENQFDQLPNPVSAKGFLRSYARCLGLEEAPILNRFSQVAQPSEPLAASSTDEKVPSYIQRKQPDHLPFPLWAALAVVGVIVLFLVLSFLMPKNKEAAPPPPPEEILSDDPIPPEPSPIPPPPEGEGAASPEPSPPAPTPSSIANPAPSQAEPSVPLVLLVEARESSWVHATIDGTEIKEALLQPGESVRWEAREKFLLTVGNAGGVRLLLDGRDLGSLGPSGKVVKREIVAQR
jgi:transcriptional regulator with XRE-family HTH domain